MASLVSGLALGVTGLAGGSAAFADQPQGVGKVFICHATGSESNPYVKIEVARSAVNAPKAHSSHVGPVWYPGAKAAGVVWGDIIPPVAFITAGLNWVEGEAIFLNGDCELPTTGVSPKNGDAPPTGVSPESGDTPPTGVSPESGDTPSSDELPETGSGSSEILLLGGVSVVLGTMLVGLRRKPVSS